MAGLGGGTLTAGGSGGDNGFFSFLNPVFKSFQQGLQFAGSQIMPRYFANELLGQQFDQLRQPTFYAPAAPPRINDGGSFTQSPKKTGLLFDNINLTGGSMLLAAIAVVGVVILIKD